MMCAFMTPVLKNDWEIYRTNPVKTKRSRTSSGSSQKSTSSSTSRAKSTDLRRRCFGEYKSMSYHSSPDRIPEEPEFAHTRSQPRSYHLSTRNSRNSSRASFSPHQAENSSPPVSKDGTDSRKSSTSSISKFHSKVLDKLRNVLHRKHSNQPSDNSDDEDDSETRR